MTAIGAIEDISIKILSGQTGDWKKYGDVVAKKSPDGKLILFNYTNAAQYAGRWNWFERNARGLIFDAYSGSLVARPFPKIFNWGERQRFSSGKIRSVEEKLDGSLIILFYYNGRWRTATRGSFDSDQAQWAAAKSGIWTSDEIDHCLDRKNTYLLEAIYDRNRIVVEYDYEGLVLLNARDTATGAYVSPGHLDAVAAHLGWRRPKVYDFRNVAEVKSVLSKLPVSEEGFVVEFDDGQRFKFKGEKYLELHKALSGLSINRVLEAVQNGTITDLIEATPDEFLPQIQEWWDEIEAWITAHSLMAKRIARSLPNSSRKAYAQAAYGPYAKYGAILMLLYDGRPIRQQVAKRLESLL